MQSHLNNLLNGAPDAYQSIVIKKVWYATAFYYFISDSNTQLCLIMYLALFSKQKHKK